MRTFDFIQEELDYINKNANFTNRQQKIFDALTDKDGRQKIYQIARELNVCEKTVSREIIKIDFKIIKLFLFRKGLI